MDDEEQETVDKNTGDRWLSIDAKEQDGLLNSEKWNTDEYGDVSTLWEYSNY